MENILEQKKIKAEKMKIKMLNLLCKIANYKLQILIIKTSILSDHENAVLILIDKIFPKGIRESMSVCKRLLLFLKINVFQEKRGFASKHVIIVIILLLSLECAHLTIWHQYIFSVSEKF